MRIITTLMLALVLALGLPAAAHHSDAGIDMESTVTLEGTVTEFHWRNPHVYFMVEAPNEQGEPPAYQSVLLCTGLPLVYGGLLVALAANAVPAVGPPGLALSHWA